MGAPTNGYPAGLARLVPVLLVPVLLVGALAGGTGPSTGPDGLVVKSPDQIGSTDKSDEQVAAERAYPAASDACRVGTTAHVGELYVGMIVNPRRMTPDEQILDCLKRHGVVDQSYTMAGYRADLVASFGEDAVRGGYDPSQATGGDLDTEETATCRVTPWV